MEKGDHVKSQQSQDMRVFGKQNLRWRRGNVPCWGHWKDLYPVEGRGRWWSLAKKGAGPQCPENSITVSYGERWGWNGSLEMSQEMAKSCLSVTPCSPHGSVSRKRTQHGQHGFETIRKQTYSFNPVGSLDVRFTIMSQLQTVPQSQRRSLLWKFHKGRVQGHASLLLLNLTA